MLFLKRYLFRCFSLWILVSALIIAGCSQEDATIKAMAEFIQQQNIDRSKANWKTNLAKPPQLKFSTDKHFFWDLQTNKGNIVIELMPQVAPMHVSSTIYLTNLGFYDGIVFHRVINDFMAQGGDPLGVGSGGPGYYYDGEFSPDAKHDKAGVLSMANRGPRTDGSQFFLTFKATPHLDGMHTVFGHVVEGMDTLKLIESLGSYSGKTKEEIKILKATIRVKD